MDLLQQAQKLIEHHLNSKGDLADITNTSISTIDRIRKNEKVSEGTLMKVVAKLSERCGG